MRTFLIRELGPAGLLLHHNAQEPIPINSLHIWGSESSPIATEWKRIPGQAMYANAHWIESFMAKPVQSGEYQIVLSHGSKVEKAWYDKENNTWYMGFNVVPVELIACWRGCTIPFCPEG